jgi:predicted GNAT family acetyltransferase
MEIVNDEERRRFVVEFPEGQGELIYRLPRAGVIELFHTEVDPLIRGRGVAGMLAQHGFDVARAKGWKVVVTCPYVKAWAKRHPEVGDLIVER